MKRRWIVPVLLLAMVAVFAPLASAEDKAPDATIRLSEGTVAAGIGWNWGRAPSPTWARPTGSRSAASRWRRSGSPRPKRRASVYNLKSIDDFNGVFAAAGTEGTAGKGAGVSSLRNPKGVVINLKSETKGANIKIAAEGLKLEIEK